MSWKKIGIIVSSVAVFGALVATGYAMKTGQFKQNNQQEQSPEHATSTESVFETAGSGESALDGDSRASLPGELISFSTVDIHPLSEGIITEMSVRVGQRVEKGAIIGLLSAPPASVEQAMAAADKAQMLVKARTNAASTEKLVREQIEYLKKTKESIAPVRDTGIAAAGKEFLVKKQMQSNSSIDYDRMKKEKDATVELAKKERDSAIVKVAAQERTLRSILEQTLENNLKDLTSNYSDYRLLLKYWSIHYKSTVVNQERSTYEESLSWLIRQLQNDSAVPDEAALSYVNALRKYSITLLSGEDMASKEVADVQKMAREQESMVIKMVNELRDERAMRDAKEAELSKMIAMRDSELIKASQMIATSALEADQSDAQTKKMTSEAQLMYIGQKREIDEKISMLKRELEMAKSDVLAAETSYSTFIGQLSAQRIVAQSSGTVSGINKNVGDYVMPKDTIASITTGENNDVFVRFRLSGDSASIQAGTEVVVTRPGFPFDRKTAVVTGVGTSLNEQGAYVAEAEFDENPSWPVRALVRVSLAEGQESLLVPFSAIGWDEEKQAHLKVADEKGMVSERVVTTGRAIGDRIEILTGLMKGEKYAIRYDSTGSLKMTPPSSGEEKDGHGHNMGDM